MSSENSSSISITLPFSFAAGHLYKNSDWTEQKNLSQFGKCYSDYGHGHDYRLEIEFQITTTESLKTLIEKLKLQIQLNIIEALDHKHFNFDIAEFKNTNHIPTTENIGSLIRDKIQSQILRDTLFSSQVSLKKIRLFEGTSISTELLTHQ